MGGKAKKPDPVPVSEGEKIQASLAKQQIDYYRATYAPLERRMADEANQDFSSRFSAQAGTAGMRQMTDDLKTMALSSAPVDSADLSAGISDARVEAFAQGRRERDDARLDALGVGLGMTAAASRSLTDAGRIQTNAAIEAVQAKMAKQQAKGSVKQAAVGALAAIGSAYGMNKFMQAKNTASQAAGGASSSPTSLTSVQQQLVASRGKPIW